MEELIELASTFGHLASTFGHPVMVKVTLPETSIFAPENRWLEDEISFWDGPISGAMLVSGSVVVYSACHVYNVYDDPIWLGDFKHNKHSLDHQSRHHSKPLGDESILLRSCNIHGKHVRLNNWSSIAGW